MFARGPGRDVYYAGDEALTAYKEDPIACRGMVRCAPVATKMLGPDLQPLRASEKPVTLLQYLITTLVRSSWILFFALILKLVCAHMHV